MNHRKIPTRRSVLCKAWVLAVFGLAAVPALQAQNAWPEHPIKLVVPYPAGGNADSTARLLATQLSHRLGQQVVVDNRPGGGGTIGAGLVAKAPADGYTLLLDATAFTVNPSLYPKLPYDAAKDFAPISQITRVPMLLVVPPNSPLKSVGDLVHAARGNPGKLSFASAGNGGAQHLAGELFKQGAKISMTHIPYRGGAPALTDLAGGTVDLMFSATSASGPFVKAGKLRALAITSAKRSPDWPQLPTIGESVVPGFEVYEWNGLFAPARTPPAVTARLEKETRAALATPELRQRLADLGAQPVGSSSAEFTQFVRSETAKWGQVVKASGIHVD
ncbi:tripartite tricarboxylate transporter substrate binding protein [Ramlibacter ginsenosidimutans]|uniref:Tripartite tricarboxylate transporter substrate binding protein n=1 Tax=Ramlibacter ginsenosidimutans TaxID=502333 RepID=A0A934TUP3_9BURK|nr:tripartite tricarboxylate transporter substrate binding protein [Ramlibacter ginsenosidimutans]MBK6007934.1 tripartite tricarboxylate transporter substrate binding protein [Ramlibacter ginsenosidimutans]